MAENLIGFRPKEDDLKIMAALRRQTGLKDSQILKLAIRALKDKESSRARK
jgi:hypothetical protein